MTKFDYVWISYWSRKKTLFFSVWSSWKKVLEKSKQIFNIHHSNFIVTKSAMRSRGQTTHMRVFGFLHSIPVFPFDIFANWMIAKSWAGRGVGAFHTIVRSPDYWGRHNHPTCIKLNTLKWERLKLFKKISM